MNVASIISLILLLVVFPAHAVTWSTTELHFQYGELEQVGTAGAESQTRTLTLQHADGWQYGDNFFFIDYVDAHSNKQGNNPLNPGSDAHTFYGEWYSTFSLSQMTHSSFSYGVVKDIGLVVGVNVAEAVESWWLLPGLSFTLDLPGFNFAKLIVSGYFNHSYADANDTEFKVLDEGDSFMVDFSWDYPFKIGHSHWSVTGHAEYIDGRYQRHTFGEQQLAGWILAQPQLRLDVGDLWFDKKDQLYVGIEYQYWHNKLGERGTHDNEAQLLAVWRF